MTGDAIAVNATAQGFGIRCALLIGSGQMLVLVMTKVLCSVPGLVLAIAGHRCPGKLEWQKNEDEDRKPAAHGPDCISILLKHIAVAGLCSGIGWSSRMLIFVIPMILLQDSNTISAATCTAGAASCGPSSFAAYPCSGPSCTAAVSFVPG